MFKEQIQNNNSDHGRSYLTQIPACSIQCYQGSQVEDNRNIDPLPGKTCRQEAALEISPSCVREPF